MRPSSIAASTVGLMLFGTASSGNEVENCARNRIGPSEPAGHVYHSLLK